MTVFVAILANTVAVILGLVWCVITIIDMIRPHQKAMPLDDDSQSRQDQAESLLETIEEGRARAMFAPAMLVVYDPSGSLSDEMRQSILTLAPELARACLERGLVSVPEMPRQGGMVVPV